MIIIPAIDLLDEKVVRLKKGIMEDATEYGHDAVEYPCGADRPRVFSYKQSQTESQKNL